MEEERVHRIEIQALDLEKKPRYPEYVVSAGLLSIASYIREKENVTADYLQYDYFEKHMKESSVLDYLKDFNIVGITANTDNYYKAIRILNTVKRSNSNILTVIGGPHVTYQDVQAVNDADIVVKGEGEETFREIVSSYSRQNYQDIKSITYKDSDGRIRRNPPRELLNLNHLSTPAFDLIPNNIVDNCLVYLPTSRGCPYKCAYCVEGTFWKGVRYRNHHKVVEDIAKYLEYMKTKELFISDSTFNSDEKRVSALLGNLKQFDLYYYANVRSDILSSRIINLFKKHHFIGLFVGLQSASKKVLNKVNRSTYTLSEFDAAFKKVREFPFSSVSFIFGLPSETIETVIETISIFSKLYDLGLFSITPTVLVPYPGTPIFEFPEKYGIKILVKDFSKYSRYDFPVYRSSVFDQDEIWGLYLRVLRKITEFNCLRVGIKSGPKAGRS